MPRFKTAIGKPRARAVRAKRYPENTVSDEPTRRRDLLIEFGFRFAEVWCRSVGPIHVV
jgi:hypothetical protein